MTDDPGQDATRLPPELVEAAARQVADYLKDQPWFMEELRQRLLSLENVERSAERIVAEYLAADQTIAGLASYFGVSEYIVERLVSQGELEVYSDGSGKRRVPARSVRSYITRNRVEAKL